MSKPCVQFQADSEPKVGHRMMGIVKGDERFPDLATVFTTEVISYDKASKIAETKNTRYQIVESFGPK